MSEGGPKIAAIIPVRGGSKSLPRKNIKPFAGKPLLAHMLEAALGAPTVSVVAVSSEDPEVLAVAREYGKGRVVVIERPADLAQDNTPSLPVIKHAVEELEKTHGRFDFVTMLQATTPLVRTEDIDAAHQMLIDTNADTVLSMCKANSYHPVKMKKILESGKVVQYIDGLTETENTRQKLPAVYRRNGGIYAHKRDVVMEKGLLYGSDDIDTRAYLMSDERSVDINSLADFLAAEAIHKYLADGGEERFGKS